LTRKTLAALALGLAVAAAGRGEDRPGASVVKAVDLEGIHAYQRDQVLRIVRVQPDRPLGRPPEASAQTLETRDHDDGYPAATVAARYDEASGRLSLVAEEGVLAEVVFEGLSSRAAATAARVADLKPGRVLRDIDVIDAFDRLWTASDGALGPGDDRVEAAPDGARLVLAPTTSRLRLSPLFGGNDLHPVYPWTRVDGLTLPLGGDLTVYDLASYDHLRVYAAGFYATSAGKLRYVVGASKPFGPERLVTVGYEHHDLTDTDDLYRSYDLAGAAGTGIYFETFASYFRRQGDEGYLFARVLPWVQAGVSVRSDRYDSLAVTTGSQDANDPITPGEMRSVIVTLSVDPDGAAPSRSDARSFHLQRSLYGARPAPLRIRLGARLEMSGPGVLGGDFDFRRFVADVRGHAPLGSRAALDARGLLGLSSGTLPLQKLFALGGVGTLRGYPNRSFVGDRLGQVTGELRVDPGRWIPRGIAFYDGGEIWSDGAGDGWKSSIGLGLQWPADAPLFVRVDVARPVGDPSLSGVQTLVRLQIPF
jgi:hypothetical protein